MKKLKKLKILYENHVSHENHRIARENHNNHESHRITF